MDSNRKDFNLAEAPVSLIQSLNFWSIALLKIVYIINCKERESASPGILVSLGEHLYGTIYFLGFFKSVIVLNKSSF